MELLVVIAIISILAGITIVSINPKEKFEKARNTQRQINLEAISNAIKQNIIDNKGAFVCINTPGFVLDENKRIIKYTETNTNGESNLAPCINNYLPILPTDPKGGFWNSEIDYNTLYTIEKIYEKQIKLSAPLSLEDGMESEIYIIH